MATAAMSIEFARSESGVVVAHLDRLTADGRGRGWVNLGPALTEEEIASIPHRSGLGAWFSGRGPAVPMATWTPAVSEGRPRVAQVGVAHGTGPNALSRLSDTGLELPASWVEKQDHAKHGIVAELPSQVSHAEVIEWLLAAMTVLSPAPAAGSPWIAEVHEPG